MSIARYMSYKRAKLDFDSVAEIYDALPIESNNDHSTFFVNMPRNTRHALDVGCGTGNFLMHMHNKFDYLVGMDISNNMINVARRKIYTAGIGNCNFVIGDAENLPFAYEKFDFVFSHTMLHHCPNLFSTLVGLKKLVASQGKLVLIDILDASLTGFSPILSMNVIAFLDILKSMLFSPAIFFKRKYLGVPREWNLHQMRECFYSQEEVYNAAGEIFPGVKLQTYFSEFFLTRFVKIEWDNLE